MDYFTSCIIYGKSTRTPLEMQIWYLNYKIYRTTTCGWVMITRQVVSSLGKTLPEAYNLSSSGLLWCCYCVVTVFVSWVSRQDMSSCQVMWRNWLGEGCVLNLSSSQELFTAKLTLHKMFCGFKTLGNSRVVFPKSAVLHFYMGSALMSDRGKQTDTGQWSVVSIYCFQQ